jgi:hypothetical protein
MLKKATSGVLVSKISSTYPEGTPPVFSRLRPCWMTFLIILMIGLELGRREGLWL